MKSTKHILMLTPLFPEDETYDTCQPSLQVFVKELALSRPDVKVSVISFHQPVREKPYKWHGVDVYTCNANFKNKLFKIPHLLKVFPYAKEINKKQKIDCIHSFWLTDCAAYGNLLSNMYKIPHYCTAMGQDVRASSKYLKIINFKKINKLVMLSSFQDAVFKKNKANTNTLIIAWGLDVKNFPKFNNNERPIDILGVGSLIGLKNYQSFIRVVAELVKQFPNIKTYILGEGVSENQLRNQIKKLKLEKNIILTGQVARREVVEYMSKSKILLHPSNFESQGYIFYEALHSGMQVISFKVGIAEANMKWFVAKSELEIIDRLSKLLLHKQNYDPHPVETVEDTVRKYCEWVYF